MLHQPIVKELMKYMSEHTGLLSSYQLHITAACTNTGGKMKSSRPRAADWCHLYLDIGKSGYLFHGYSGGMKIFFKDLFYIQSIVMFASAPLQTITSYYIYTELIIRIEKLWMWIKHS